MSLRQPKNLLISIEKENCDTEHSCLDNSFQSEGCCDDSRVVYPDLCRAADHNMSSQLEDSEILAEYENNYPQLPKGTPSKRRHKLPATEEAPTPATRIDWAWTHTKTTPNSSGTCTPSSVVPPLAFNRVESEVSSNTDPLEHSKYIMAPLMQSHPFIDSHCHIDFLFEQLNFMGDWKSFKEIHKGIIPANFHGCVQVFCEPRNFTLQDRFVRMLRGEPGIWFAFGVHPKRVAKWDQSVCNRLVHCLDSLGSQVVAVGEIGLDYSQDYFMRAHHQQKILRIQVMLAVHRKLPIVIHCREGDRKDCKIDADTDLLQILQELCPRDQKIHVHCFTRNWSCALRWITAFPNAMLGITPLITWTSVKSRDVKEVALKIPLDKLLIETDAPYFLPRRIPAFELTKSQPWFSALAAQEIASIRGISINDVLRSCFANTLKLYGIIL